MTAMCFLLLYVCIFVMLHDCIFFVCNFKGMVQYRILVACIFVERIKPDRNAQWWSVLRNGWCRQVTKGSRNSVGAS